MTKISSNRLPTLVAQINNEHQAAASAIKAGIAHALSCGDALNEAKDLVPHGQWGEWLATNTSLSERSAQRYMQIARERPTLESKTATVADLTIRGACELIAKPPAKLSETVVAGEYVPGDGHSLVGIVTTKAGNDIIIITPSLYAYYFFVSHVWVSRKEDCYVHSRDVTLSCLCKPARWQSLADVVTITAGIDMSTARWREQPYPGPLDHNPWANNDPNGFAALWEAFFQQPPFEVSF